MSSELHKYIETAINKKQKIFANKTRKVVKVNDSLY